MIKQRNSKVKKEEKANPQLERKTYIKPKLVEHGQLEKLTQGGVGSKNEPHGGFRKK